MNLKDYVAISGLPGLYKVVANRANGLVVSELDSGKSRFCSVRKHQFTILEAVAIFTETDSVELHEVFKSMKSIEADSAIPKPSSKRDALFEYFGIVLPDFDRFRVLPSDIKKVIKWYQFLNARDLLEDNLDSSEQEEE